jgi:hypothetical protein
MAQNRLGFLSQRGIQTRLEEQVVLSAGSKKLRQSQTGPLNRLPEARLERIGAWGETAVHDENVDAARGRWWSAELHRLRGVFLAAVGAGETQIEASFCEAIRIAKERKSVSLEKRAEATYTEYRRQKASASEGTWIPTTTLVTSAVPSLRA